MSFPPLSNQGASVEKANAPSRSISSQMQIVPLPALLRSASRCLTTRTAACEPAIDASLAYPHSVYVPPPSQLACMYQLLGTSTIFLGLTPGAAFSMTPPSQDACRMARIIFATSRRASFLLSSTTLSFWHR